MIKRPVFQFKITLLGIEPTIWCRIQISDQCTFWDLHVAIQDAMGWTDSHLHLFELPKSNSSKKTYMGIPGEDGEDFHRILPGWDFKVSDHYKTTTNQRISYLYDFGDKWKHLIEFEGEQERIKEKYPVCLTGSRACPPEDVGGIDGYENFIAAINDPENDDHERLLQWIGGVFDQEKFEPKNVTFDNPKTRLKRLFR